MGEVQQTGKRVLITGAAGFLGSHLCDRFIREGYQVVGMDNLITGDLANIQHLFKLKEFEFYHHDVSKFVFVPGPIDYILHFASPASPIDYLKIPIQTLKVGSLGTHNLLGFARVKKARILGTFLEVFELFDLKRSLETLRSIVTFFKEKEQENFPVKP